MSGMIAQRVCVEAPKFSALAGGDHAGHGGRRADGCADQGVFTAATQDGLGWAWLTCYLGTPRNAGTRKSWPHSAATWMLPGPLGYLEICRACAFADAMKGLRHSRAGDPGTPRLRRVHGRRCARRSANGCRHWPSRPSRAADMHPMLETPPCLRRRAREVSAHGQRRKAGPGPPLLRHAGAP